MLCAFVPDREPIFLIPKADYVAYNISVLLKLELQLRYENATIVLPKTTDNIKIKVKQAHTFCKVPGIEAVKHIRVVVLHICVHLTAAVCDQHVNFDVFALKGAECPGQPLLLHTVTG